MVEDVETDRELAEHPGLEVAGHAGDVVAIGQECVPDELGPLDPQRGDATEDVADRPRRMGVEKWTATERVEAAKPLHRQNFIDLDKIPVLVDPPGADWGLGSENERERPRLRVEGLVADVRQAQATGRRRLKPETRASWSERKLRQRKTPRNLLFAGLSQAMGALREAVRGVGFASGGIDVSVPVESERLRMLRLQARQIDAIDRNTEKEFADHLAILIRENRPHSVRDLSRPDLESLCVSLVRNAKFLGLSSAENLFLYTFAGVVLRPHFPDRTPELFEIVIDTRIPYDDRELAVAKVVTKARR